MTEELITKAIKDLIGKESEPVTLEVEGGHIRRFAEAIEDLNPLYIEERHARKSNYGGIIAPPTFIMAICDHDWMDNNIMSIDSPAKNIFNGGNEIELYEPLRVGDKITVTSRLVDAVVKEGSVGKMLFLIWDFTYTNQLGDVVAKSHNTMIRY